MRRSSHLPPALGPDVHSERQATARQAAVTSHSWKRGLGKRKTVRDRSREVGSERDRGTETGRGRQNLRHTDTDPHTDTQRHGETQSRESTRREVSTHTLTQKGENRLSKNKNKNKNPQTLQLLACFQSLMVPLRFRFPTLLVPVGDPHPSCAPTNQPARGGQQPAVGRSQALGQRGGSTAHSGPQAAHLSGERPPLQGPLCGYSLCYLRPETQRLTL